MAANGDLSKHGILLCIASGVVLSVAAILKLLNFHSLFRLESIRGVIYDPGPFYVFAIFLEIALAIVSFALPNSRLVWRINALFWFMVLVLNILMGAIGIDGCQCFGALHIPQTTLMLVDFVFFMCFTILLREMPGLSWITNLTGAWRFVPGVLIAGLLVTSIKFIEPHFANVRAPLSTKVIGSLETGSGTQFQVEVKNLSLTEIDLIGVKASCTCVRVFGLPRRISPNETLALQVEVESLDARTTTYKILILTGMIGRTSELIELVDAGA